MKSNDLINWTRSDFRVDKSFPGFADIGCVWAPEPFMMHRETQDDGLLHHAPRKRQNRLYYSYANDEFTKLDTEPEMLFEYPRDIADIDGDIAQVGDKFHLFITSPTTHATINQALSNLINPGYGDAPPAFDPEQMDSEAPNVLKRIGQDQMGAHVRHLRPRPTTSALAKLPTSSPSKTSAASTRAS